MSKRLTREKFMKKYMPPILFLVPAVEPVPREYKRASGGSTTAFQYQPNHFRWFLNSRPDILEDGRMVNPDGTYATFGDWFILYTPTSGLFMKDEDFRKSFKEV